MNRKRLVPIALLVVALGVGGVLWSGRLNREKDHRILLSGNIELTQADISFKVPGKLIELRVDEGAAVKKGMLIARIDREQIEQQKSRDQASVESAKNQLTQLGTSIEWQKETVASDTELKRAEVRQAQAHLNELLAGSRPQDIQGARAMVSDSKTQQDQAARDWARAQTLYKNDDISTAQFDQFRARAESTAAALRQAEEKLALVVEGPRKEEIESARAQVARAQAALRMTEANRLEIRKKQEELGARRAEIDRAKAQVAMIESQIGDTAATSPVDGVVLVKAAEVGEVLGAGTSVVTIGDLDHPWLRGYIGERDLGRVKFGAKVKLSTDSFPGKTYWGRVSFIASQAEFTPKQIQTKEERVKLVYRIKVEVDNPEHELKANMPVDAEIVLE